MLIPFLMKLVFQKTEWIFWEKLGNADDEVEDTDWDEIHIRNFKCSIVTRLRSFYFKIFHKAVAFNDSKLTAEIPLTVIFVINSRNLFQILMRFLEFLETYP